MALVLIPSDELLYQDAEVTVSWVSGNLHVRTEAFLYQTSALQESPTVVVRRGRFLYWASQKQYGRLELRDTTCALEYGPTGAAFYGYDVEATQIFFSPCADFYAVVGEGLKRGVCAVFVADTRSVPAFFQTFIFDLPPGRREEDLLYWIRGHLVGVVYQEDEQRLSRWCVDVRRPFAIDEVPLDKGASFAEAYKKLTKGPGQNDYPVISWA